MSRDTLLRILALARWAPSGDNTQPWRFEIIGDDRLVVHCLDTRDWCVYDLDGRASEMAVGALLETMRLAAGRFGYLARLAKVRSEEHLQVEMTISQQAGGQTTPDPLHAAIKDRRVCRRPLSIRPIGPDLEHALRDSLPQGFTLAFYGSPGVRLNWARLLSSNGLARLLCPEAYQVHRRIIDWGRRFSRDRIPEQAVGVDPLTARLMRWVMRDWERVDFFNRYLMGTFLPRLQLDLIPGWMCGAHVALLASGTPETSQDFLDAGSALQRLWLASTLHGLQLQPEMTPVIFSRYVREDRRFTSNDKVWQLARTNAERFTELLAPHAAERVVFLCRLGFGPPAASRSLRLRVAKLLYKA